ncbi:conserved oligomeric Golgi complex subunit 5 [Agrilus planipennis]|uniref:Conserved oligomeric Golgi complex subunit 5 n=1 Tax=Agrilus planipennis TaxID=224129 RepID=A0A1W4WJB4_AGRPL|nr:conserved oligomeric Golgi complex subunit 5 [Agrilus planipennis]
MEKMNEEITDFVENDDFYKKYIYPEEKSDFPETLTIAEQVKKLGEGIELLNRELQKQVCENYDDLIRQANHANKLEAVLNTMSEHVQNLFGNADRIKAQIEGPYHNLETHTLILEKLHLASHILRQVSRIQQLSKRLSTINDPIQKATILQDLEQLASDPELTNIDAVTNELRNIRTQQQKIVRLANISLTQGIANENMTQSATALQIFINLGTVKGVIQNTLDICLHECRESLKTSFDINVGSSIVHKSSGGPGKASVGSSQGFRNKVWVDLEKAFGEEIFHQCNQVKFLQSVLDNIDKDSKKGVIAENFWKSFAEILLQEINSSSPAVTQTLEVDYPNFLKLLCDMINKLNYKYFTFNRNNLEKIENSYLSNSFSRMMEPTQAVFTQESSIPSHDQIDSILRTISNEISVALIDEVLTEKIVKNVSKCIRMFCVKTEQQVAVGPEAAQVLAGTPNSAQQLNINLANTLFYLQNQVQRMLANMKDTLPKSCVQIIDDSLKSIHGLTSSILQPLIISINVTIEKIIVTIHQEPDWNRIQIPTHKIAISCSPYMRELTEFVGRVFNTYLVPFENKEVLTNKCSEITIRCIELLVQHTSILRPISQGGRLRLQADFNYLENTLRTLCPFITDLGRPYRLFKSMATLIALSPKEIVASQVSGSSVPHSTVLLLLFSYAEPELASPHQNMGWSITEFTSWLDKHTLESDRLDLIAGALQRYENVICQKNSTNFDPVYPIMSEFLAVALKK